LKPISVFIFLVCVLPYVLLSQTDEDDTVLQNEYYSDLSDLLHLKLYSLVKINTLEIKVDNDHLRLEPNGVFSLGAGFNFKGFGIGLGFGIPSSQKSIDKYGKTTRFDIQASIYSKRIGGDAYLQAYKGYFCSNPGDFVDWDKDYYPQLPDMQTTSLGVSIFYIFNNKKFSYKAAFVRTQIQKKTAGSFTAGLFVTYDDVATDSGFFPTELPDSVGYDFDLTAYRYFATGVNVGYMFTWIISKSFFLNIAAVPGLGYRDTRIKNIAGESASEKDPHAQILLRGALGYEHEKVYIGLTASTLIRNMKYKDYDVNLATEQFRLFVGMRFDVSKKNSR